MKNKRKKREPLFIVPLEIRRLLSFGPEGVSFQFNQAFRLNGQMKNDIWWLSWTKLSEILENGLVARSKTMSKPKKKSNKS